MRKVGTVESLKDLVSLFRKLYYPGQTGELDRPKGMSLVYPCEDGVKVEITLIYVPFNTIK